MAGQEELSRPALRSLARDAFQWFPWSQALSPAERTALEDWSARLTEEEYVLWVSWATVQNPYVMMRVLHDPLPRTDLRSGTARVETRSQQQRRLQAEARETDPVYRVRRFMEEDIVQWENHNPYPFFDEEEEEDEDRRVTRGFRHRREEANRNLPEWIRHIRHRLGR